MTSLGYYQLALYAVAALGYGTLLWLNTRDTSDHRTNRARRVFLAILGALAWPGTVIVGLLYLTTAGRKVVDLAVFGRTTA